MHRTIRQATNHLIISIQSHVLAPALFYCIKTTRFKLLCATVVEPISSAWPVIATVTRWNPLACVGVDWAICMCCSYLAMPAMLRVVSGLVHLGDGLEWNDHVSMRVVCWTRFGKGIDERPCRSTWWVVSLKPSLSTEICMCDLRFIYYNALGPKPMDPLGFLFTLVLCPGVASSFWCL